ncbi:hypothetical protein B0H16DRAFT_1603218 [Mycena metata]|uniref:F-box domain-containing protein n=1 Tax=Mycena metata TaxID=1033252 RepID=A0AAD7HJA7_9AGAR|nr:hypothetical protein B0H16DRAFT_1603218 [Mycena metata]
MPRAPFPRSQLCAEPSRCLFAMCTHALSQLDRIVDPVNLMVLKNTSQTYVCAPYRYVPQVPQEIIDHIVDNIEDMASLKACSLVCWAFVPASRTHIFREVSVDMLRDAPRKLHSMLLRSPQIIRYIKDLTIYRTSGPDWGQPNSPLSAVISMLTYVTRFSIFGCWGDWKDIPVPLASALQRIISSGRLERLHFLTCSNVPVAVVQNALCTPILSLFQINLDPRDDPTVLQVAQDPSATSCEYLNLSASSDIANILKHLRTPGSTYLSRVRRIVLNPLMTASKSPQIMAGLLSAVETTLERLDVQVHQFHFKPIDTSRLRRLRTIQLHVIMEELYTLVPDFLPRAITRLRSTNPLIEHIVLVMHLPAPSYVLLPDGALGAQPPIPTPAAVAGIAGKIATGLALMDLEFGSSHGDDGGLAAMEGFHALRSVHWKIVVEASPPMLVPEYASFLAAHLPRARARGVLSIEQTTRELEAGVMPHLPGMNVWPHRPKKQKPVSH